MMIDYIRSSSHASDTVRKKLTIDAQFCSLTAVYGQYTAKETLHQNAPSRQSTSSVEPGQAELFSTVQVSVQNGTWGYIETDCTDKNGASGPLKLSFQQLSVALVSLDGRQDKRSASSRKRSYPSPIAIGARLAASTASLTHGQVALSLGAAVFNVREHAPVFVKTFVISSTPHLKGALRLQKRYAAHHTQSTAFLIAYQVLKYSRHRTVVDPLSTIQPSYLIQKGLPDELRRSSCFKFLVHLRSCLRSLEATERLDILSIRPSDVHAGVTMRDLCMLLEKQDFSQTVDEDIAGLPRHPFMEKMFDASRTQVAKAPRRESPLPMSGSLHFDALSLVINHDADDEESTLFLGPLDARGHVEPCNFLPTPHVTSGKSYGNLAAAGKGTKDLLRIASSIKLQNLDFTITPRIVVLVNDTMRLAGETSKAQPAKAVSPSGSPASPVAALLSGAYLDLAFSLQSAHFAAAAEQLLVEFSVSGLGFATTTLSKPRSPTAADTQYSMNHSLLVDETALRVRPRSHINAPSGYSTLASFLIYRSRLNVALLKEPHQALALRVVSCVDNVELTVPRSALNVYRSLDDWKEAYLSGLPTQDHLPSPTPTKRAEKDAENAPRLRFSLQLFCGAAGVTLQVARGTWFSWKVKETAMDLASDNTDQILPLTFGLQAGPHVIGISTRTPFQETGTPTSHIEVELPMVTVKGTYSTNAVHGTSLVESFHLTVKPADWDTLLSVYQKSEQGFSDLVRLSQETRPRSGSTAAPMSTPTSGGLKLSGSFRMKGFRIGVEGRSSTVFLECDDIGGSMGSQAVDMGWQIRLSDLSLSLASRSSSRSALDRGHRSAFVTIDFEAKMRGVASRKHVLEVLTSKVHAVMQPTSIGELSDFIDSLQVLPLVFSAFHHY